jgi:hypothetical protein
MLTRIEDKQIIVLFLSNGHSPQIRKNGKLLVPFWRVLEFDKFDVEWPLLNYFTKIFDLRSYSFDRT